ncbi:hypothetical protein OC845_006933, partial [Tilletia horrida]
PTKPVASSPRLSLLPRSQRVKAGLERKPLLPTNRGKEGVNKTWVGQFQMSLDTLDLPSPGGRLKTSADAKKEFHTHTNKNVSLWTIRRQLKVMDMM